MSEFVRTPKICICGGATCGAGELLHLDRPARSNSGDDVIYQRLALVSKGNMPSTGLQPHTDLLNEFPYLGKHPSDH